VRNEVSLAGQARIYLAGPDVFLPDPLAAADAKKALCRRYGFVGVFPLDGDLDLGDLKGAEAGFKIAMANEDLMRSCDLLIANMTPFRCPSMDVGTAYEMGFMRALGRPVLGYSNQEGSFAARTRADICLRQGSDGLQRRADGQWTDGDGLLIEDFAMGDNLMMVSAVMASGGTVATHGDRKAILGGLTGLVGFEECLQQAVALGLACSK
jgi:nucleoside 2-deoxyribosyltransferase